MAESATLFPLPILIILITILPAVVTGLVIVSNSRNTTNQNLWNWYLSILCNATLISFQLLIVCVLKNITGLPRPDMFARCIPYTDTPLPEFTLSNVTVCSNTNTVMLYEGFRSFPSGHSSTIFASSTFQIMSISQHFHSQSWNLAFFVQMVPLSLAFWISSSRISDNRHFLRDIVAGAFIGTIVAFFTYRKYFSKVSDDEEEFQC